MVEFVVKMLIKNKIWVFMVIIISDGVRVILFVIVLEKFLFRKFGNFFYIW